jgi:azurin
MTKDDIIRMLHEVGYPDYAKESDPRVIAFASLVAAAEREACAKLCEEKPKFRTTLGGRSISEVVGGRLAEAIRARSQS